MASVGGASFHSLDVGAGGSITSFESLFDDLEEPPSAAEEAAGGGDGSWRGKQQWGGGGSGGASIIGIADSTTAILEENDETKTRFDPTCPTANIHLSYRAKIAVLSISTILSTWAYSIAYSIYKQEVSAADTDLFTCLLLVYFWTSLIFVLGAICWRIHFNKAIQLRPQSSYVYVVGLVWSLAMWLITVSSYDSRTPFYLRVTIALASSPLVIIIRTLMFRDGYRGSRLAASGVALAGLFITAIPHTLGLVTHTETDAQPYTPHSLYSQILWPLCYFLSMWPLAFFYVMTERVFSQTENPHPAPLLAWIEICKFLSLVFLSWTNIIDNFGLAHGNYAQHFKVAMTCHFNLDPSCARLSWLVWVVIFFYIIMVTSQVLLVHVTASGLYTMMALSIAAPLLSIWWSLFTISDVLLLTPNAEFTASTGFAIPGLLLAVVSVWKYGSSLRSQYMNKERQRRTVVTDYNHNEDTLYW